MKAEKVLLSGLLGTTAMTVFSYIVSEAKRRNFKEPELLAALLKDLLRKNELAIPAGWSTHYSMGISWAVVFKLVYEKTEIEPGLKSGIVLGGLSGLTAIVIWRLFFKLHRNPPRVDFKRFYGHLLLAHIVYSISVSLSVKDIG